MQGRQRGYPHEASQNLLKWQICERSFKRNDIPLVSEICVHYSTVYCDVQYCLIFKEAGLKKACLRGSLASRRLIFKEAGLKEACLRGGLALRKLILLIFKEAGLKEACLQGGLAPPKPTRIKTPLETGGGFLFWCFLGGFAAYNEALEVGRSISLCKRKPAPSGGGEFLILGGITDRTLGFLACATAASCSHNLASRGLVRVVHVVLTLEARVVGKFCDAA